MHLISIVAALSVRLPFSPPAQNGGSLFFKRDQSNVLTPEELQNHDGWHFVRDAAKLAYDCGATAVFVYGSCKFDPVRASDVDLLVCCGVAMREMNRYEAGSGPEVLMKRVDAVKFDTLATACFHVRHNIGRSYFVSRDGFCALAKQALPLLMIEGAGGPQREPPPLLADEIPTYLDALNTSMSYIAIFLESYCELQPEEDARNTFSHFYPKADTFKSTMYLRTSGSRVRDAFYIVERVLKRICTVQGVTINKSGSSHEEIIRELHTNTKLRGFLPNQGQLTEEYYLANGPRSRTGELHRLRKVRNRWGEETSTNPMQEVEMKEWLCFRELKQALKDYQVVYDAVDTALDDGKFNIPLVK